VRQDQQALKTLYVDNFSITGIINIKFCADITRKNQLVDMWITLHRLKYRPRILHELPRLKGMIKESPAIASLLYNSIVAPPHWKNKPVRQPTRTYLRAKELIFHKDFTKK